MINICFVKIFVHTLESQEKQWKTGLGPEVGKHFHASLGLLQFFFFFFLLFSFNWANAMVSIADCNGFEPCQSLTSPQTPLLARFSTPLSRTFHCHKPCLILMCSCVRAKKHDLPLTLPLVTAASLQFLAKLLDHAI